MITIPVFAILGFLFYLLIGMFVGIIFGFLFAFGNDKAMKINIIIGTLFGLLKYLVDHGIIIFI